MSRQLTMQDVLMFYNAGELAPSVDPQDSTFTKTMINTSLGTGVSNPIYGAQAWYNLNSESNTFGLMPKQTWDKSGFRTINAFTRAATAMAISETGTLPTPTVPTINVIKLVPKVSVNTFEVTQIVEQLAKMSQDDIYANLDAIRLFYATEHVKLVNQQLDALSVGTGTANSVSGASILTFESIDRIVSSYGEGNAIGLTGTSTPTLAHVINPWAGAIDRSGGAGSFDSVVISPTGTINSSGAITDATIRSVIQKVKTNGGRSNVFMTGYDTYADLQGLYLTNWRTLNWGELAVKTGLNGIETAQGLDTGVRVAAMYGIPVLEAVDTAADAKSRVYLLDTTDTEGYGDARFGLQILNPTAYLETGERDFLLLNALAYEAAYYSIGELECRFPAAQGKIRDIS